MKTQKIKRYRLGVSRIFPKGHPRAIEPTYFVEQIKNSLIEFSDEASCYDNGDVIVNKKLHTIRSNYPLWEKRMKEVQEGRAVIELFYWSGKPYNSPQIVFATLDKDSGCGVQELSYHGLMPCVRIGEHEQNALITSDLAKNDGLSFDDFKAWFKGYDLSEPLAIIHFTKFRY